MKNLNDISKLEWVFMSVGGVLVISILLNFLLYFNGVDSILGRTHKVDKKINNSGITWVGIKTTPSDETAASNYELWRIGEDNEKLLIENFPLSNPCFDINWSVNEKGSIDLLYTTTPCVDFAINTHIIYNAQGIEQFRMKQDSSKAYYFTFKQKDRAEYETSLLIEGTCEGYLPYSSEDYTVPKVLLKGVKLTKFAKLSGEKEFTLAKPEEVECGVFDEIIINPTIETKVLDEEHIEFTLPNNQKGIISLRSTDYPEVEFQ